MVVLADLLGAVNVLVPLYSFTACLPAHPSATNMTRAPFSYLSCPIYGGLLIVLLPGPEEQARKEFWAHARSFFARASFVT